MSSVFSGVEQAPPVPVFALSNACKEDPHPNKVNLTVGAYRTDESAPWVLPVVRTVESQIAADETLNKEYLPITGMPDLCNNSIKLLLGSEHPLVTSKKAAGVQSLGGTGALRLGIQFLKEILGKDTILISNPTWPNHVGISKNVGINVRLYRYWDAQNRAVDFSGLMEDIGNAPDGSVIVLHACAHNPTGMDPTHDQWQTIMNLIKKKNMFPLFDIAYQGFASGDLDKDAWAVRLFANDGMEFFAAQSYSKNFGLYNERVGNLCIATHDPAVTSRVLSQMQLIVRRIYSNPSNHGARIVANVINNSALYSEWKENVKTMADRIILMRKLLFEKLKSLGTPGKWDHIIHQIGMFSYTGLTKTQVQHLRYDHHIYMMEDGRMTMCGLTTHNVDYVANAIHEVVTKFPE